MIYWFTGQPGHGKTLHGIDKALKWVDEGRLVYACNIREFNHEKAGMLPMTPEEFREWMTFLPDGSAAIVDEAYEHQMLPKRPPGSKLPVHVEQLAKHRHRGIDFIFISQSPAKQVDEFVHDLIERHVHVRRRFGTKFVHLREFDRFERNPEKAHPINLQRVRLPKRPMGLYISTESDTTEKKVPWYYYAAAALAVALVAGSIYVGKGVKESFTTPGVAGTATADGAPATAAKVGPTAEATAPVEKWPTLDAYATAHVPRFRTMPHTAPVFDGRAITADPEVFCMASDAGFDAQDDYQPSSCTCQTEQGTDYTLDDTECRVIARKGPQYNPYKAKKPQEQERPVRGAGDTPAAMAAQAAVSLPTLTGTSISEQVARYGGMRAVENAFPR